MEEDIQGIDICNQNPSKLENTYLYQNQDTQKLFQDSSVLTCPVN